MSYLITFDSSTLPEIQTDTLIIGMGIAGLSAGIQAAEYGKVLIVTKASFHESNTEHAQGGVAVVLADEDTMESHIADTLTTGCGLCNNKNVKILVEEGPQRIRELIDWGVKFDKNQGKLSFGQEGGHSLKRIIHANGDATGKEILRGLLAKAKANPNITLMKDVFVIDLLVKEGVCVGAIIHSPLEALRVILARNTILATGGTGQIYRETTNSKIATGDGMALAFRAGAILSDMEFIQFHPTTLYVAGASRFLISEAVRGEGGILRNKNGERFMFKYHPSGELAPRDIVSRGIWTELKKTNSVFVWLDVTHLDFEYLKKRFPNIVRTCLEFGLDLKTKWIPVRPTAHYMVGGVKTDENGQTNIGGLYACGEAACTGVHGANRLASNSLLEGLVFGYRAGEHVGHTERLLKKQRFSNNVNDNIHQKINIADVKNSLASLMLRNMGIERDEKGLLETKKSIDFWMSYVLNKEFSSTAGWELQNMLIVANLMQRAALTRQESRGVHFRKDYPYQDDEQWKRHVEMKEKDNYSAKGIYHEETEKNLAADYTDC
ncbi:L-aspartate oxidase [Candidatus Desantisbacteria bacterium]|nr:L-aspartate oxidase [Candidatus Desantisbacteria bacterium]